MFTFHYVIKNFLSPIVQPKINKTIAILKGTKNYIKFGSHPARPIDKFK